MIKIVDGAFLFKRVLSHEQQSELVSLYQTHVDYFYRPKLKSGHYMNLKVNCFGYHWSALDYKYHKIRTDADQKEALELPSYLQEWAAPFSQACFKAEKPEWDICIANYYGPRSKLGMHSDNSETKESLSGKPIVSFSIGASCLFKFGGASRNDPYTDIRLDSGDVFVFGGPARLNYHGVSKIIYDDQPFLKELDGGRLNFTLRKL